MPPFQESGPEASGVSSFISLVEITEEQCPWTGVVVPIFKKGDRKVFANYWGITLLSLPGKVYAKVLEMRLQPIVEPQTLPAMEQWTSFSPFHRLLRGHGCWAMGQPSLHVFCGYGEGLPLCSPKYPVGGPLGLCGAWATTLVHSISVLLE
ncbi:hypothetical protein SRHO_G00243090 [Serrasalmus rhombeus]